MNTKNGTVISGYQFSTWKVALNGISKEPLPHRQESRGRADEADHAEDALAGEEQHHHGAEHEKRDEFGTHAMGFPRAAAMSLKRLEMHCSSSRKMPKVMIDLDRPERRRPGRVVLLAVDDRVVGARNAAGQQHHEIEDDEENGYRVGEGPVLRRKPCVEQVHADMPVELHGIGPAEQVVGRQQELRHLQHPVDGNAEERRAKALPRAGSRPSGR